MTLAERWDALWSHLHLTIPDAARAGRLLARYQEPQRAYHTVQHLEECLHWFDETRSLARDPFALELAIWYHDAIYAPRRSDNEQASADLARLQLGEGGATAELVSTVAALILWTTHSSVPPPGDPALLVDIDLAILGSPPPRYAEYERQIRQEYSWVPMILFRKRRGGLLAGFLARPQIYATPMLRDRLEQQARINLTQAIDAL